MYDEIYGTSLVVFDDASSEYVGKARFNLTDEAEKRLLSLVNYNRTPDNLMISNVELVRGSEPRASSDPFAHGRRHSILNAIVRERHSKRETPIEIEMKYDRMVRSSLSKDPNLLESALLNNIEIIDVRPVRV